MPHRKILRLWPHLYDLARDLDVPYGRVRAWSWRGHIPPEYWLSVVTAAARRELPVTLETLAAGVRPAAA